MALTACAPSVFRADVGALFASGQGEIALQNAGGSLTLHNEQNQVGDNLGLGDVESSPYVRLQWDRDRHRVRVHGFGVEGAGSGTLAGDFGGLTEGTLVNTSMTFLAAGASYAYEVYRSEALRIGLGGQIDYNHLKVAANSGMGREEVVADGFVPMPFGEVEYSLDTVTLGANAGVMSADLGDANGRYMDVEASVRWQATGDLDLLAGYRYLVLDAFGRATNRDFDADIDFHGWFISGGVRF